MQYVLIGVLVLGWLVTLALYKVVPTVKGF